MVDRARKLKYGANGTVTVALRHAALFVACLGAFSNSVDAQLRVPERPHIAPRYLPEIAEPNPWILIGKETTYVTGPVAQDGYIDYLAALNAAASESVTTENNAAALLVRSIDLSSIPEPERERFFSLLGVAPSRNFDGCFQESAAFLKNQGDPFGETIESMVPWSPNDFRTRAKWLSQHEKALDVAVEATRRTHCYFPLIRPANGFVEPQAIYEIPLYGIQTSREIGRALIARALLRIGAGKIAEARQDLLACHRLARLVGSGPLLLHGAVSRAIEIKACVADAALLQYRNLSAVDAVTYRDELGKLPPQPSVAHQLGHGERLLMLGFATELARKQQADLEDTLLALASNISPDLVITLLADQMGVMWDVGMRSLNKEWDRWVAAIGTPIASGRGKQLAQLGSEIQVIVKQTPTEALRAAPVAEKGRWMGKMLVAHMLPRLEPDAMMEDRVRTRIDLVQLGLALAAYHAELGRYPTALAGLVPKYCQEVPADRFTAKPLIYRLEDDGYMLYSAGDNGIDDSGRGSDFKPPGDDIVMQIGGKPPTSGLTGTNGRWLQLVATILAAAALGGLAIFCVRLMTRARRSRGESS